MFDLSVLFGDRSFFTGCFVLVESVAFCGCWGVVESCPGIGNISPEPLADNLTVHAMQIVKAAIALTITFLFIFYVSQS